MTAPAGPALDAPPPGKYSIDTSRSTVTYSGRHMFGLGGVRATFTINKGDVSITDPPAGSTVDVSLDAGSFRSNSPKRDKDVRSAALLDVAAFPEISFRAEGLRPSGALWLVSGHVTAHGNTVPVEVMVDRFTLEGGGIHLHAKAEHLDRYAFGVQGAKGFAGRHLDLDFDVFASLAPI